MFSEFLLTFSAVLICVHIDSFTFFALLPCANKVYELSKHLVPGEGRCFGTEIS